MTPKNAVIIPHYNDAERLARCLAALGRNDLASTEVVIADNGSSQPLGAILALHPWARLVREEMKGAANARNRGVRETTAERLFFLDADCVPDADWIAKAVLHCADADLVGGVVDVFDETPPPRSGAQAFETVFAFNNRDYVQQKGFSVTANLLTTRTVFDSVGPFVNGLSEDAEWCLRARARGLRIAYAPDLRVSHPTRGTWAELRRKWRRITDEMFALHRAGGGGRMAWAIRAAAIGASSAGHIPKVLASRRLRGPAERARAVLTLVRLRLLRCGWMLRQAVFPGPQRRMRGG